MNPLRQVDLETRRQQRREARTQQTYRAFLKSVCAHGRMKEEFAEPAAVAVLCALERRLTATRRVRWKPSCR